MVNNTKEQKSKTKKWIRQRQKRINIESFPKWFDLVAAFFFFFFLVLSCFYFAVFEKYLNSDHSATSEFLNYHMRRRFFWTETVFLSLKNWFIFPSRLAFFFSTPISPRGLIYATLHCTCTPGSQLPHLSPSTLLWRILHESKAPPKNCKIGSFRSDY